MKILNFKSELLEKKQLTEDTFLFRLSTPKEFDFEAGQFISVKCSAEDETKWKSYSILSPPSQKGVIDLCIKIIPGGFASGIFSRAEKGNVFEIRGPMGNFRFDKDSKEKEHWFLAAGTGVTPFYSMLKEHIHLKEHKFVLVFGAKYVRNLVFYDELRKIEKENNNFTFLPIVSREEYERRGHVQAFLPKNLDGKNFYICGLKELVTETEQILLSKNVEKERIKKERYS